MKAKKNAPVYKDYFEKVQNYCMFVGYPRSSHSLIGSLLDAHPEIVIGHEEDALKFVNNYNFTRDRIFWKLLRNSQMMRENGRQWSGYSYEVKNQYQGKFEDLKVIGDKKGANSTKRIREYPVNFEKFKKLIGKPFKIIHVYRNPYDNLGTIAYRTRFKKSNWVTDSLLENQIRIYFGMVDFINKYRKKQHKGEEWIDVKSEDFIQDPSNELKRLCDFLEVSKPQEYIEKCSSIVYESPRKSRHRVKWSDKNIQLVKELSQKYDLLKDYSFEDD
ncbi:MAG: sulfotransferase [Flavobacteriales bacterium]